MESAGFPSHDAESGSALDPHGSEIENERSSEQPGCSFADAAWDKFNWENDLDDLGIYVPKKGPAKITDSGHLILPWHVNMDCCGITKAGQHSDMTGMCQHVMELDLAHNNITSIEEVLRIIRCMPKLTFLNLTSNPLNSSAIATATTNSSGGNTPDVQDDECNVSVTMGVSQSEAGAVPVATSVNNRVNTAVDANPNTETTPTTPISTCSPAASADNNNIPNSAQTTMCTEDGQNSAASSVHPDVFPTVRQLVLNGTCVDWSSIVVLLKMFPSLEELHLSLNNYTSVDLPLHLTYPSLTHLFFNNEDIDTWSQVSGLGRAFPNLRHLYLAGSAITSLDDDGSRMAQLFPCLEMLSLNKTQLKGWDEVDKLRHLPALTDVRVLGIPFLEEQEEKSRREQLVTRLPNIKRLNGSCVKEEERLDAERAFLRLYQDSHYKPDRFFELEKVHGRVNELANVNLKPQTVFSMDIVFDKHRERMEVNAKQTVRDFKKSLQNIAGMPSSKFVLFYLDKETHFGADRMIYPDKKLYSYNLKDGSEFIIEPKH
ncbi:tubulin-specific chaperone cofactor E-like protein isoform X1 [Littorina saxatilis]|uniref:Ubiquitin-like domain-containing protein n=1 Tax=Littorina saxatilis TaxID=31220 RepID=A0AAN9BGY8_9CAEN